MKPIGDLLEGITDQNMRKRLQGLHKAMQAREGQEPAQPSESNKPQKAEIVQLPFWPEPTRGVPNSTLRGALFAAVQGKGRRVMQREIIATQNGMTVRFTGLQLDQSDLDIWEQALHLARQHPLGNRCEFTAHGFLKALGRATGKSDHEWLKNGFARLFGCGVEITHGRFSYGGSLLEVYRDEERQFYRLEINPKLKDLYVAGWTATDWTQRQQLRGKPLALWLHGFYATHADPYPISIETIRQLSGSQTKVKRKFTQNLKKALEEIKAIGAVTDYEISNGLVAVERPPSASQKKHLSKAKPRRK